MGKDEERGKKPPKAEGQEQCSHDWEKEYYLGAQTGDLKCTKCGATKWAGS